MAFASSSSCSPLDIYLNNIDTYKVIVATSTNNAEKLPDDSQFIPLIEECCFNVVNATYRHRHVDQVAIILFRCPITDITECENELRSRTQNVFISKLESRPCGVVVVNSDIIDRVRLNTYIHSRKSGIGPDARPVVVDEGTLLIVRIGRNIQKVLQQVFSRFHSVSGQPVYFQPYFPCFHDTVIELLRVGDSLEATTYPGTPYPDTENDPLSSYLDSRGRDGSYYPRNGSRDRSYSPGNSGRDLSCSWNGSRDRSYSPGNGGRYHSFSPGNVGRDCSYTLGNSRRYRSYSPVNSGRDLSCSWNGSRDRSYSPGNGSRDRSYSPGNGSRDRSYSPGNGGRYHSFSPGNGGCDRSYSPGNGGRDRSFSPGNGGRDRSFSPGNGWRDRSYSPGNGGRDRSYSPGNGSRDRFYSPGNIRRDRSYSPGNIRRDRSYSPWNVSRDRSYSPGNHKLDYSPRKEESNYSYPPENGRGNGSDSPYEPSKPEGNGKRKSSCFSSEDGGNERRHNHSLDRKGHDRAKGSDTRARSGHSRPDAVGHMDLKKFNARDDDKKETIKIDTSLIWADDEEKNIVAVCLESSLGKQFITHFQKDEDCEIDVKFKQKPIKKVKTTGRSDDSSGLKVYQNNIGAALMLGLLNPVLSMEPLDNEIAHILQKKPERQSHSRQTTRSDSIEVNGTKLSIKKGDVTCEKADVMVSVVSETLEINEGLISRAYARRGGDELTQNYEVAKQMYDDKGIIICDGGKLPCKNLTTVVLKPRQDSSSDQNFSLIIESVFQKSAHLGFETIVLPVMGCGKMLQYPLDVAIAVTIDTCIKFLKTADNKFKKMKIVAFDDKAYKELAKKLQSKGTSSQKTQEASSRSQSSKELCSISLSACGSQKVKRLAQELTRAIKANFLSSKYVPIPSSISIRIKTKLYMIAEKHTKMPMKMEFDQSGRGVLLTGEMSQMTKVANDLTRMLSIRDISGIRKRLRCSPSSWYNLAHDNPISPPYWSNFKANTPLTVLSKNSRSTKRWALVPADEPTRKAVRALVEDTWDEKLVGQGRDAVNLSHRRIKVEKVERIENIDVYNKYATRRLDHFRMLAEEGSKVLKSLEDMHVQNKGKIATTPKDGSVLYEDMFPEINEHYFFHGTKSEVVQTVLRQGLDCRMSNEKAMLGLGIYGAETSTKADQYADNKLQRTTGSKKMLLVRMLLGNMFVCKDHNPMKYRRPPCRNTSCLRDNCTSGHGQFDSVVGDGHWLFREFVVYSADQCYPEYLITYRRE
ncbi:uncharacterized protein LOC132562897 [Ylistrum balloti]|uniref:uncharacterized protein LOC132562897 n=1 Tax=Ylistrum balloti TaxID=509963 RepID=UPI002905EF86|nr:uncharacterized protein LOC132562897 [Ylistrum balloti]